MSSLKEFKNDADRIMNNITVSSELRERTLTQLRSKRTNKPVLKLIPAVCLAAALILVIAPGSPFSVFSKAPDEITNPEDTPSIMMADPSKTDTQISTLPANTEESSIRPNTSILLNSLEEAKEYLDGAVLTPSYIPEGFKLDTIQAVSSNAGIVQNIYLAYTSKDMTFVISIEKDREWKDFSSYRDVDINGITGHIKSYDSDQKLTELRWFVENVLYSVEGSLSEEQAVRIAQSLE